MTTPSFYQHWKNTSDFPDAWAKPTIEWLIRRANAPTNQRIEIRRGVEISGSGRATIGGGRIFLRIRRTSHRECWKDHRYSWDPARPAMTPFESFVFLAAHEIHHTTSRGADQYETMTRSSYEFRCNEAGTAAVKEFRETMRPKLLALYVKSLRREKAKERTARERLSFAKARAADPSFKVEKLRERRDEWQKKADRAQRAISKLNRRISAIAAAQVRKERAAAKGGA